MKRIPVLTMLTALLALWTIAVFGLFPSETFGAVPQLINFQGQLKDGSGNPVPNGSYSVAVRIYDVASGLNPALWSDTFSVSTTGGLFNVVLGSEQPLPAALFSNSNLWVGVQVGGDPEATPRTQLTSVPYSARVGTVDGATGGVISGDVSIQSELNVAGSVMIQPDPLPINPALSIQGSAGQTANLMEVKNNSGTSSFSIKPDGSFESKEGLFSRFAVVGHMVTCGESLKVAGAMEGKNLVLKDPGPIQTPLSIQGSPGQTANLLELQNELGAPLVSIGPNGDMDGLNSSWENVGAIDINCNGTLNVNGPVAVQADVGQTANLQEWRIPLPGGGLSTAMKIGPNGDVTTGPLQVDGSIALNLTTVTQTDCGLTLDKFHSIVIVDYAAVAPDTVCTINLPTAAGIKGRQYTIKRARYVATPQVRIDPYLNETIDGNLEITLFTPGNYFTIVSDGANWHIIASGNSP